MSDWTLLRVAAEAAEAERLENAHRWPQVDECDWFDTSSGPEYEYLCAVSPTTVLALIDENESLRKDAGQWRALVGRAQDPVIGYTGCVICGSADHGGWSCQNYPGGKS